MTCLRPTRLLLAFALSASLRAQVPSQLPPAKPSAARLLDAAPPTAASVPTATATATPAHAAHRPEVTFAQNLLTVRADNASLNQILREVGRQTGMKITGGVAEERVFGTYGPATPDEVLNTLLDGTGSNVLLLAADAEGPGELILTPRNGGVTPPNPNAPGFDDDNGGDDAPAQQQRRGVSLFGTLPQGDGTTQQQAPPTATANPADSNPNNSTNPQSPNGVKTPLEIFQQLQQLRQQQSTTTTAPPD